MWSLHTSLNTAHSGCKLSTSMSSSTHTFQVFLFLLFITSHPCHLQRFYRPTPNHPHVYSRCPNHLNLPRLTTSAHPLDGTNPHRASCPLATPRTFISPSSVSSFPDFADSLSSSPRAKSHMSIHSGTSLVYLPLYGVWCTQSCQDRR